MTVSKCVNWVFKLGLGESKHNTYIEIMFVLNLSIDIYI